MTADRSHAWRAASGKLFGDRGYISQALAEQLFTSRGLLLITKVRKNMRERVLRATDKLLLREGCQQSQAVPKHSREKMMRLREQDTCNRGLLILHAAFRGQCAYHSTPPSQ